MRWTKTLFALTALFATSLLVAAQEKVRSFQFAKGDVGKVPTGWKVDKTGTGEGSVWKVVADDTAPSKSGYVLAQTAESPASMFNLCVAQDTNYKDVELSVAFKPIAGKNDQGGGLVWRYKDHDNYYVARLNPVGSNSSYAVYKVENGRRTQQKGTSLPKVPIGEWHTLQVKMTGNHIECSLDGKKQLEADDSTFQDAGKVGLWSKSDAQTHFDDFKASGK
jgi:hypothetical protein